MPERPVKRRRICQWCGKRVSMWVYPNGVVVAHECGCGLQHDTVSLDTARYEEPHVPVADIAYCDKLYFWLACIDSQIEEYKEIMRECEESLV